MDTKSIEILLGELLQEIQLITVPTKVIALKQFETEFLTSDMRQKAYAAFDGERTLQQISEDIDCKLNTLQVFVQMLVEKDLVNVQTKGNSRIISKSVSKIALYYANKNLEKGAE